MTIEEMYERAKRDWWKSLTDEETAQLTGLFGTAPHLLRFDEAEAATKLLPHDGPSFHYNFNYAMLAIYRAHDFELNRLNCERLGIDYVEWLRKGREWQEQQNARIAAGPK